MSAEDFFTFLKAAIRAVAPDLLSAEHVQFPTKDWGPGVKDILVDKVGSSFFAATVAVLGDCKRMKPPKSSIRMPEKTFTI